MATCVKSRISAMSNPTDIKQSNELFETIISSSVSQIIFSRQLIPEEYFEDIQIGGQNLKILPYRGKSAAANEINSMLREAFDALKKNYLSSLEMHLCPENDPNHVIECYSYNFTYSESGRTSVIMVSSHEDKSARQTKVEDCQQHVCDLLLETKKLMKYVIPFGENFLLRFRLYYREGTPDEYNPPGYTSSNLSCYQDRTKTFVNGIVQTTYHKMMMKSYLEENIIDVDAMPDSDGETHGEDAGLPTSQFQSSIPDPCTVPSCPTDTGCTRIGCICGIPVDSVVMIACAKCSLWQHGACYRILSAPSAPPAFNCFDCYSKIPSCGAFTDMSLQGIGRNEQKYICMYRYALVNLVEVQRVTVAKLAKKWHVSLAVARVLMNSLAVDDIVTKPVEHGKDGRLRWTVNMRQLEEYATLTYFVLASLQVPFLNEGAKAIENSNGDPPAAKPARLHDKEVFEA